MKRAQRFLLLVTACLATPAMAQRDGFNTSDGTNDRGDHYNNQASIVPDTALDNVRTERGRVRSDRNDVRRNADQITDDNIQARDAQLSYRDNLRTGNVGDARVDAAAIEADRRERLQHERAAEVDYAALRRDQQDLRQARETARSSTVPAAPSQSHPYNGQTGTVHYGAVHTGAAAAAHSGR